MNISEMLQNPWIIGGGVVVAVLAVVYMSSGTAAGNAGSAYATGEELNLAAQKYAAEDYATSAQIALGGQAQNTTETVAMLGALITMHGQAAQVQAQLAAVNGSIMQTQITAGANIAVDRINSNLKLAQTYIGANVAMAQINADVTKTKIAAKTSEHISNNSLFGSIAGDLTGIAKKVV